jgi:hypothetical protein
LLFLDPFRVAELWPLVNGPHEAVRLVAGSGAMQEEIGALFGVRLPTPQGVSWETDLHAPLLAFAPRKILVLRPGQDHRERVPGDAARC